MKNYLMIGLAFVVSPMPAAALEVVVQKESKAAPSEVWAAVGDFCGIEKWHPAVAKCELTTKNPDTFRALSLKGGGVVNEKQLTFDRSGMTYSYAITESPLPVKNYTAVIGVKPNGSGSILTWSAKFDSQGASDAEAVKVITGIFEAGLVALQTAK